MAEQKKYLVIGRFDGKTIKRIVYAYSSGQAKLKAGFEEGCGGQDLKRFVAKVRVRRKK